MDAGRNNRSKGGGFKAALGGGIVALGLCAGGAVAPGQGYAPVFVGFYDAWDRSDRPALPKQLEKLDVFAPRWITVRGAKGDVVVEPDHGEAALAAQQGARLTVMPLVSNAHDDIWDAAAADAVILDPTVQKAFAARLVQLAQARGFAGYVFDFENLSPRTEAAYGAMLKAVRQGLSPSGRQVWATMGPGPDEPLPAVAAAADAAVLMAYDECWATSNAGPIAGADWLARLLSDRLAGLEPRRVVVAMAAYGYDWPAGAAGRPIGAAEAMRLAARLRAKVARDPASQNVHFAYTAADGRLHQVWFIDAGAFAADRAVAARWSPRGYAIWRLGLEDPALWTLARAPRAPAGHPPAPSRGPAPHPCNPLKPPS